MAINEEDEYIELKIRESEAMLLNNALNEICNGPDAIEDWEFHTRTGSTKEEAQALLDRIGSIIEQTRGKTDE